ncbi:MAG TPA: glycosyltransferase family A protein [Candidatus Binataceae bacterium]|nr:glycosyltransferase family A protein [Candidatus Binataceae bacterium]
MSSPPYLAITPARDEAALLGQLVECMVAQQIRPQRWIIIDDSSRDATGEIIDQAARRYSFIEPVHLARQEGRAPGGESVIMQALPKPLWQGYDWLLRLDADLSFAPDFAALLLAEFARDPRLGIAGASLLEWRGGQWHAVGGPAFHTRGATKFYSRRCFEAIGGLEAGLGWDTVDEARAWMKGFTTRTFLHVQARHHRPCGGARGFARLRLAQGVAAYNAGYSPLFMMARALRQLTANPPLATPLLMLASYWASCLRRRPRLAEPQLVRFIRHQQHRRLLLRTSLWR